MRTGSMPVRSKNSVSVTARSVIRGSIDGTLQYGLRPSSAEGASAVLAILAQNGRRRVRRLAATNWARVDAVVAEPSYGVVSRCVARPESAVHRGFGRAARGPMSGARTVLSEERIRVARDGW